MTSNGRPPPNGWRAFAGLSRSISVRLPLTSSGLIGLNVTSSRCRSGASRDRDRRERLARTATTQFALTVTHVPTRLPIAT